MKITIKLFAFLAFIVTSCQNKHQYKYVEICEQESLTGGVSMKELEEEVIDAATDSIAYLRAYEKFCISLKVYQDMKASEIKMYSVPKDFKLIDDKNRDISKKITFANKHIKEEEVRSRILRLKSSLSEITGNSKADVKTSNSVPVIDSVKVKSLEKLFRIKEDEFSNNNKKWYTPRTAPLYANANGIYCYFQTEFGIPSNFRFRIQYYNDDWLFFNRVQFAIDGKAYEYVPVDTETDVGDGGHVWEWFDEAVSTSDKELINALANAKNAKMKLIGRQYHDTKIISQSQLSAIRNTLELYNAMGGGF